MATILGGIATSHTPTIGFALDTHKQSDPVGRPYSRSVQTGAGLKARPGNSPTCWCLSTNRIHVTSFFP